MAAACLGAAVVGGVIGVVVTWRYAQSALVERASPAVPGGDETAAVDGLGQALSDGRRLQEAAAAAYPGADFYLSMSEMKPDTDDGSGKILWTASFYPKDLPDDLRQQLNKRMRDRKNDYLDGQ